jgi:hypothetical protein
VTLRPAAPQEVPVKVLRLVSLLVPAVTASALVAAPVSATTLIRRGLDRLAAGNETIVQARVLDIRSYWNADHTFILTDVHARPSQVLKGRPDNDLDFTVMGGTVGETTTLIVGGPDLEPGSEYILFLAQSDLPGAPHRLTVRDLSQGVFDVVQGRAFSQAHGEPLLPDDQGRTDAPGGDEGILLETLARQIRDLR